jgi:pimeloyl-ACP methyl ester carboxylesterase
MYIETIYSKNKGIASKGTILLLHGVCFGAWYWEDNFLPWFADKGYEVIAMSYRNHGSSEVKGSIKWRRINEYLKDIDQVVKNINGDIYIIGHSMGGFLTQHYLQKFPNIQIKKSVFLCTVPASGVGGATWQIIKTYPLQFIHAVCTFSFLPVFRNHARTKKLMFSHISKTESIAPIINQMQDESFLAYLDMLLLNRPTIKKLSTPSLFIAAAQDFLINPTAIERNAQELDAEFLLVDGAHNINLEDGWKNVAHQIADFFI